MVDTDAMEGSCYCGAVSFSVVGNPIVKAFCHCSGCQRLSGCPFVHTIHFPASAFSWTHSASDPESFLDTYKVIDKPSKTRYRCKSCGVCVAAYNFQKEKWSVWGALFPRDEERKIKKEIWDRIKPEAHIFYGTRLVDVNDGLSKWEGYEGISTRLG